MPEAEPKSLYKLLSIYGYRGLLGLLPGIGGGLGEGGRLAGWVIMAGSYFRGVLQFAWQGCKYRRAF